MNASIISIGDELLIGQVINTNASYIAEQLNKIGISIRNIITIGDNQTEIISTFKKSFSENDLVFVTGGLGPTHDDITKKAVCKFFNTQLVVDDKVNENIKRILELRNLKWNSAADEQTLVPEGCNIIQNNYGTAAGFLFERNKKYFIVTPGVPYEMKGMMSDYLIPFLQSLNIGKQILHRTLKTTGITEASLAELIGDVNDLLGKTENLQSTLAFLPAPTGVRLRISITGTNSSSIGTKIVEIENNIRAKAGKYIYGTDDEELEEVIGKLLTEKGLTISVAESCTGGLIANRITNVSGSSKYFERGVVTYSNKSKTELLGVPEELIIKHGAVSEEVAKAMAEGVRKISKTDIGISTTGIAGPTGGTAEKPVGLVWVGYSDKKETFAQKFHFGDIRLITKIRASQTAMEIVRNKILNL
ncbi:MAG: competence/damage-inducible protein A [Bacteroidota bacterium]|nr:competence/damage-inducible protein A [Bacteroidota bacterium]